MRTFNSENCTTIQRDQAKCVLGGTISLFGKHSKQWSTLWVFNGENKQIIYPNRIEARNAFNNLKLKIA